MIYCKTENEVSKGLLLTSSLIEWCAIPTELNRPNPKTFSVTMQLPSTHPAKKTT
jgi:hypothetical protein